ncbi:tRNA (adenosine(37)-N6)-threonylcarbamoyltransferase complex dimerization subunit type 1 TsaB [Paraglaciecola aquimarina]|uniref:tRNA threonylcarbamoyladenosine biosynthesis protein TsaB n=1 Tax=Paraglaciecola algarum TaxID=3050085 RepID=A0ABS9DA30_9ALTE|nr:tRNA (adenosine(37)-N6)-threonylcarbamoyltransferase complex dimerization subunit type 1 TsaB [Paraglaciecola sp. G1-23]MCF2949768.1 tRNA (adenosine(37)-N6)-threonylcarbamoyltransferase complex dimerization subunit type 1 TsaB [Paraglaciecola sp. G1-23]
MNILIIETATEACSVALQVDGKQYSLFEVCPQQHSQRILPMVDQVLKQADCKLQDLDYLGFGRGPGSFTGVRIATGILQGLALGTGLKVVGVSTLAAMAQQAAEQHNVSQVFSAIDARMSEVYFAQYEIQNGVMQLVGEEQVLPPESAQSLIKISENSIGVGTGWTAYPELNADKTLAIAADILYPDAKYMLAIAEANIADGKAVEVEEVTPVYLRDKVTWKKLPGRE